MQQRFHLKTVIVTGASSSIGSSTARAFLHHGAQVVLAARREESLRTLANSLDADSQQRALVVPTDVTQPDQVAHLFSRAVERFGRVDILVNNAGFGMLAPVADTCLRDARELMGEFLRRPALHPGRRPPDETTGPRPDRQRRQHPPYLTESTAVSPAPAPSPRSGARGC